MRSRSYSPLTLCFTGFTWLTLASILGLAILIGLVRGTPLPSWIRALHVHAVLIGGVAQIILGGFLLLIAPPQSKVRMELDSHPITLLALNGGLVGMLVGFWLHHDLLVSIAGFVVIAGFLSAIRSLWARAQQVWNSSWSHSWYYALAFFGLVSGSICGELMALGIVPESYGYVRLAHIHLVVLGFVVLIIIGMIHHLLPIVWGTPHASPRLVQLTTTFLPIGVVVLIGGFLNSSVSVEMMAGAMLFVGVGLLAIHLFRTWLTSRHTGSAASDHLLVSTFFLLFTIILGVFVGANHLSDPPALPYGKLHLVAYTHMAFIGFIVNAIMGAFSYLIPVTLAANRVTSHKKRTLYLDQLTSMMNRWGSVQIATLSLGTMGLGILAALAWNVPLSSLYLQSALWTCLILLLTSYVLFSIKLSAIVAKQPEHLATHQMPPDELKLTA
ncbi:MAG: cbb3-type cytochrome c oxidase subunit I [Nitrospira sp.]|nr:cbb3-type cytochrome c oxidase subunit I [Nitrospira sp.]MDH5498274.1 cbb3-type cytochrome c oxidase subunit I [Nitrospira sp.]MDH5724625.1 cbb3-type cytochrome c oxidase subunit I [Nitrospira sp.]